MKMNFFLACFLSPFMLLSYALLPVSQLYSKFLDISWCPLLYFSWLLSGRIQWGACFAIPHRSRVGIIRCSLDREVEKVSQVQGQPEKSSEQVRVGRDRAGDGHSKSISGAEDGGLRGAEMDSWDVDREEEDTGAGWAARGRHVAALRSVRGYNHSF